MLPGSFPSVIKYSRGTRRIRTLVLEAHGRRETKKTTNVDTTSNGEGGPLGAS